MADDNTNDQLAKLIAAIDLIRPMAANNPDLAKTLADLERQHNELTARDITADKVVVGVNIEVHPPPLAPPDPAIAAREKYLKRLRTRMNRLPLADGDDGDRTVKLEQVYIALDTTSVATDAVHDGNIQFDNRQQLKGRVTQRRILSVLNVATQHPRLALLGDPGSGKSTIVNQLAGNLAAHLLDASAVLPPGYRCRAAAGRHDAARPDTAPGRCALNGGCQRQCA